MQTYDVVLKQLLTSSNAFIHQLAHVTVKHWLNVELPQTQNPRIDLLCETTEGIPLHIELQNSNDSLMALRMAEYALQIYRRLERFPQQIVLYTGNAPLTMPSSLQSPSFSSKFTLIDIRDLDGEILLASTTPEENILSVLMRLRDQRAALRQILERIATLETGERKIAYEQLGILAGLRAIGHLFEEESAAMPITESLLTHDLLGPVLKKGIEQGIEQGTHQGAETVVRRLMQKRFGPLPAWAGTRLSGLTTPELEDLSLRLLDVQTLDELFAR